MFIAHDIGGIIVKDVGYIRSAITSQIGLVLINALGTHHGRVKPPVLRGDIRLYSCPRTYVHRQI